MDNNIIETDDPSTVKVIEPDYKLLYTWTQAYLSAKNITLYADMMADLKTTGLQTAPLWLYQPASLKE